MTCENRIHSSTAWSIGLAVLFALLVSACGGDDGAAIDVDGGATSTEVEGAEQNTTVSTGGEDSTVTTEGDGTTITTGKEDSTDTTEGDGTTVTTPKEDTTEDDDDTTVTSAEDTTTVQSPHELALVVAGVSYGGDVSIQSRGSGVIDIGATSPTGGAILFASSSAESTCYTEPSGTATLGVWIQGDPPELCTITVTAEASGDLAATTRTVRIEISTLFVAWTASSDPVENTQVREGEIIDAYISMVDGLTSDLVVWPESLVETSLVSSTSERIHVRAVVNANACDTLGDPIARVGMGFPGGIFNNVEENGPSSLEWPIACEDPPPTTTAPTTTAPTTTLPTTSPPDTDS